MLVLIFAISSAFASFLVSIYLLFRWSRQAPRNKSTLAWALGLLLYSVSHVLIGIVSSNVYHLSARSGDLLIASRFFAGNIFFLFLFWGTIRLIVHRKWLVEGVSLGGFIIACLLVFLRHILFQDYQSFLTFYSFSVLLPASLIFTALFFIFYGVLIAESVKRRSGVILIAISWVIYAVLACLSPFISERSSYLWFAFRTFSTLILLLGFIVMDREAKQALSDLDGDKKFQHHFK